MYKDPTEFRERFARWKAGEKPYKNGRISDEEYVRIMEKVAADNWQKWGEDSEDAALTRILNDNTYDYRGYYSKYPNSAANADTHWSDEFKTVWHPTFSQESTYSGKKSQFNPYGYPGGTWQGEFFNPQWYQLNPHSPGFYKDGYPKLPKFAMGTEGEPNYSDDVYKNMYYENAALPDYLKFVNEGVPKKTALDYVKRFVNEHPELYALKGPTLPEVVVKPNPNSMSTGLLTTYYPWSTDFPVTGHSTLELLHDDDNSSAFVTAYGDDPWYNFVTNNCSDATRKAIEYSTGKKINPLFFTTPGDVKDFVESELGGKSKYIGDGSVETTFSIPTKQARKIVEYSRLLNKKRFLPKFDTGTEGSVIDATPLVNFGVGMIPFVGSAIDTWQAIKDPSLVNIGTAAAGWGLDAMMLLGPAGFAARLAIKAAIKTKKAINAGKSLYRINKTRSVAKRETVKAINTALTKNRQVDAGLQLAQEAYNKYAE